MSEENVEMNLVNAQRKPVLTARQVGVAAAFGGAALALVLAGVTIPIPGTPVVTDPREIFTTIGASLTGPMGYCRTGHSLGQSLGACRGWHFQWGGI